jgi:hypothetical protein
MVLGYVEEVLLLVELPCTAERSFSAHTALFSIMTITMNKEHKEIASI